jgi:hypothetical protein
VILSGNYVAVLVSCDAGRYEAQIAQFIPCPFTKRGRETKIFKAIIFSLDAFSFINMPKPSIFIGVPIFQFKKINKKVFFRRA